MAVRETTETKRWLNQRFSRREDGCYFAHQPIYGFGSPDSEPGHIQRLARTLNLLLPLSRLEFHTFLDVGAGEGYLTTLIQRVLGASGVPLELSLEAARRARELFGLPAVVADAHELPFPDDSFDLVLASEVLEHVQRPWRVADELLRVARRYVMITTEEFCHDAGEQALRLLLRDFTKPHTERNLFTARDLRNLLGDEVHLLPQFASFLPREEGKLTPSAARRLITRIAGVNEITTQTRGVIALACLRDAPVAASPSVERDVLLDLLLKPLISSPVAIPEVDAEEWSANIPQAACRVAGCAAHGKPEAECSHIIRHPDGICEYRPPLAEAVVVPSWARKFSRENLAEGEERRRLSRLLRMHERQKLLSAPEPMFTKLAWLAKRGWSRLLRVFSGKS